jgi:hypothetical protein
MRRSNMRRFRTIVAAVLFGVAPFFLCARANAGPPPVEVGVSLDTGYFYDQLSPYGEWVEDSNYGYVWSPYGIDAEWRPYTHGHWVYTDDDGWLWVADEEWGWGPYHYGRWFVSSGRWLWVPGTEWAPAWCSWRNGGGYIGWAPLPPQAAFSVGIGLQIGGVQLDAYVQPTSYNFVEERHFADSNIRAVIVPEAQRTVIIEKTKNITNYSVNGNRIVNRSVAVETVERAAGHPVPHAKVVETAATGGPHRTQVSGAQVKIFRPAIKAAPPDKKLVPPSIARSKGSASASSSQPPAQGESSKPTGQAASSSAQQAREQLAQKHAQEKADLEKRHTQEIAKPPNNAPIAQVQARHDAEHKALDQKQQQERQQLERAKPAAPPKPPPAEKPQKPAPKPTRPPGD